MAWCCRNKPRCGGNAFGKAGGGGKPQCESEAAPEPKGNDTLDFGKAGGGGKLQCESEAAPEPKGNDTLDESEVAAAEESTTARLPVVFGEPLEVKVPDSVVPDTKLKDGVRA
ncbi:MAG: hypothetical protein SGARI_004900 [Bacillariaceae sp.]